MPNIRESFEAGKLGLNPSETGTTARAATARRVGAFYNQVGGAQEQLGRETAGLARETGQFGRETSEVGSFKGGLEARTGHELGSAFAAAGDAAVKYLDHQQISQGAPALAGMIAGKTKQWNDIVKNADPNDPTVAQKFLESLETDIDKFKGGFMTERSQQWAESHVDQFRQHMYQKTSADMSTLAGQAASVNHRQTVNALSATVHDDPSSLNFALNTLEGSTAGLVGSSPNLTGTAAARVHGELMQSGKEAIVKSAVLGYIAKNAAVPDWARDPKFAPYINGAELKQFEVQAKAAAKADLLTQKQIEQYQKQQDTAAANGALSKNFTDSVSFDENGKATIKPDFFKNVMAIEAATPGVATDRAKAMITFAQSQQREKAERIVSDPTTKQNLYDGLFKTDKPTTDVDILRAASEHKLDAHDTSTMMQLYKALEERPLKGPIWHDTMAAVKSELIVDVPFLRGKDNIGIQNYAGFAQKFIPEYLKMERAGTLPLNALDVKDPKSMISQAMEPFRRTQSQRMQDFIAGAGGLELGAGPPATTAPVTLPPIADRVKDKVYDTARGKMKWTGTGWVNP